MPNFEVNNVSVNTILGIYNYMEKSKCETKRWNRI